MTGITQIVDRMLLGENVDNDAILRDIEAMFDRENQLRELAKATDMSFSFGFAISTGSADVLEQNLREDGVDVDAPGFWQAVSPSWSQLETNLAKVIGQNGLKLRSEGHSNEDLVGTAWLDLGIDGRLNEKGIKLMRLSAGRDEPLNTSSGSIYAIEGFEQVYDGIDERIAKAAELAFETFDTEELQMFFEHLDSGAPLDSFVRGNSLRVGESFLAPRDPPGIFRKIIDGVEIYSARCPGCKRIHGNFTNYDQAAGNRQCKFCTRDYVDKMTKVTTTGNFKHILKKPHETRASRPYR